MLRKLLSIIMIIAFLSMLTACQYDFPPDSKKKPHTYDEALTYIKNYLNRDDVILSEETISGETEYGYHYTNYFATIDDINFIVSSQERCHYERLGEFCKTRYNLYNNYNYEKIHMLLNENQNYPNFELKIEMKSYLHIYNTAYFNYKNIITSEEDLTIAFDESKVMYEWLITLYPNPRYCVKMQVENSERLLYICAHKSDTDDIEFGFNQATFDDMIDEYRRFYD